MKTFWKLIVHDLRNIENEKYIELHAQVEHETHTFSGQIGPESLRLELSTFIPY